MESTEQRPVMPPSYLVWSILATIFCCLPFGIVAIVKSAKVESLYAQGDYDKSLQSSNDAKKWCIISAVVGIVVSIIAFIVEAAAGLLM